MSHRLVVFGAVFALLVGAIAPTTLAKDPKATTAGRSFEHLNVPANARFTPASLDQQTKVTVIVKLAGGTLAERIAAAKANGKSLSKADRTAIVRDISAGQAAAINRAKGLGATIRATYQAAYNGFSAKIARGQLVELSKLPGVEGVFGVGKSTPDNERSVPYIGTPSVWQDLGLTGAGVKVGVIDTGIDYFHANFGGSGDPADFTNNDETIIEPNSFPTAKVAGGMDFVGNAYDAEADDPADQVPHPDPDPVDCNGHGSHTSGTAAGEGVLSDGSTFTGPYNSTTVSSHTWNVGPGVAPEATLYAYKVFGCVGSVDNDIVVDAIDQAVFDDMDIVNMSLGSPFGTAQGPEQDAIADASAAGTLVVTSAGNSGPSAYITGAPGSADHALSTAAIDGGYATFPGAALSNPAITAINANGAPLPGGSLPIKVLKDSSGGISLGCDPAEYTAAGVTGKLVVVQRGTCARVARAIFGQQAGAAAVLMVNNSTGYPPYEGTITENPDDGTQFTVTIPFLGVPSTNGAALLAADGQTTTLTSTSIASPSYKQLASFSSGGPRNGDSAVKPDVAAPGVSTVSTGVGTGTGGATLSGTSMASPHVAGVAALVKEGRSGLTPDEIKAVIQNTATVSSTLIGTSNPRTVGAGLVQPRKAVDTLVYATTGAGLSSLSFGLEARNGAYSETLNVSFHNTSSTQRVFNLSNSFISQQGASLSLPSSVTIPANGSASVAVTLSLSASAVAALTGADTSNFGALNTIRGAITATPRASGTGLYALRIPYLLVPRGVSNITPGSPTSYTLSGTTASRTAAVSNTGIHAGTADVYALGATDGADTSVAAVTDVRSFGVQSLPGDALGGGAGDRSLVFAVNVAGSWSNAATNEYDIAIDTNNDGRANYYVVGVDYGVVTTGDFDGRFASMIFAVSPTGSTSLVDAWVATAPMNGSTMELPVLASEIGLAQPGNTTFKYQVVSFEIFDGTGAGVDPTAWASFDSHNPTVNSGQFLTLNPGQSSTLQMTVDTMRNKTVPAAGWMVVSIDDAVGTGQANTIALGTLPKK